MTRTRELASARSALASVLTHRVHVQDPDLTDIGAARHAAEDALRVYVAALERDGAALEREHVAAHLARVCQQAGVGSFAATFNVILDRDAVSYDTLLGLEQDAITDLYERYCGPAADQLEAELLRG